jgi:hypothetical protein
LERPPSINRSTGRVLGGGGADGCSSACRTAIAFLSSSSMVLGLMLAAAIRSHRSLASINAARLVSCIGDCFNSCAQRFVKAGCYELASNNWPTASEARCYGDDSLLTKFLWLSECHRNLPALSPLVRDSVPDWRVALRLFLGFDPPNFAQARMSCPCHRQGHRSHRCRDHRSRHRRRPLHSG